MRWPQLLLLTAEVLLLAGCQGDSLREPQAAASTPSARSGDVSPLPEPVFPVRVPRAFFEGSVHGSLTVSGCGATIAELDGPIGFAEGDPIGPPPEPGAIADFRDRPGYATFQSAADVGLQFIVTPDISSLPVNAGKTTTLGLGALIESKAGLPAGAVKNIAFGEGSINPAVGPTELKVSYTATATVSPTQQSAPACAGPFQIQYQFSR